MGPLQLAIHVVQNRYAGEQKSHWDKANNLVPMSLLLSREAVFYHVNEEPICTICTSCLPLHPNNLHTVCFQFLLGITVVSSEWKTMFMQFFWGGQTRCILGDVKMELRELCVN